MKWCKTFRFNRLANAKLYRKLYIHINLTKRMKIHSVMIVMVAIAMYVVLAMIFQTRFYCNSNGIDRWQPGAHRRLTVKFWAYASKLSKEMASNVGPIFNVYRNGYWIVSRTTPSLIEKYMKKLFVWSSTPNQSFYFCA